MTKLDHPSSSVKEAIQKNGFVVLPSVFTPTEVDQLVETAAPLAQSGRAGDRNLFRLPALSDLARGPKIHAIVSEVLGADAKAVRALFFDKNPEANWPVAWHQDSTLR